MSEFPLTRLLIELHSASFARRNAADPARTARHFGVKEEHAAFYIAEARRDNSVWPVKDVK